MNKTQETKARRAAVVAVLGAGWKGEKGSEGCRDQFKRRVAGVEALILPTRTVDGNFYVGVYDHRARRNLCARPDINTIEQAAAIANGFFA